MPDSSPTSRSASPGNFWDGPLIWVALAWTVGLIIDRFFSINLWVSLSIAAGSLVLWLCSLPHKNPRLAMIFLGCAIAGVGMARHHLSTRRIQENDISRYVSEDPHPAHLWGVVHDEPIVVRASSDPLQSIPGRDSVHFVLEVEACELSGNTLDVSGLVQVTAPVETPQMHVGDRVRVMGNLARPAGPANPSDFDYAAMLRDQGIRTIVAVPASPQMIVLVEEGWRRSFFGWLGAIRKWGQDALEQTIPKTWMEPKAWEKRVGLAEALLLGEGSRMTVADWDKYMRTGVLHVLAVSGEHLVVLAVFLEVLFRILRLRRRTRGLLITLILICYALLTGGRAPAMRAAWTVAACYGGVLFGRPILRANVFALAWLGVAVVQPADIFSIGCQMSFLAVLVLVWANSIWQEYRLPPSQLDHLIQASRALIVNLLLGGWRWIGLLYVANLLVWTAIAPLGTERFHILPLASLLIGPFVVLFGELALMTGFVQLLLSPVSLPLAWLVGWLTSWCLGACEWLVDQGIRLGGCIFVPDLPWPWVAAFYVGLVLALTVPALRRRWPWTIGAIACWASVTCWLWWGPKPAGSFRCTFLAVGHGGCTVIETSNNRVILYDTGALNGPEVTRRHIAPFLWQRGYWRIDEVIISHADADHFNGLPALLDYFSVRQVTTTPFFAERDNQPVRLTLEAIDRRDIPIRQLKKGDLWQMDDVAFQVLHPPAKTGPWSQNARSLVLLMEQAGQTLLLTGDLQDQGLDLVMSKPAPRIDVLMAPHHGSKTSNTAAFADWARPQVVISCQRRPKDGSQPRTPYEVRHAPYLGTWPHGAISIFERDGKWRVETFRTGKVLNLR